MSVLVDFIVVRFLFFNFFTLQEYAQTGMGGWSPPKGIFDYRRVLVSNLAVCGRTYLLERLSNYRLSLAIILSFHVWKFDRLVV